MRARLLRSTVSLRPWMAWPLAALLVAVAALFGTDSSAVWWSLAAAAEIVLLAPLLPSRRRARDATLELGAGFVDVRAEGGFKHRIRGRKLHGATTAFLDHGVGIALQASQPISLEVGSEADAKAVLDALGIGHHGFGRLEWSLAMGGSDRALRWAAPLAALCLALGLLTGWTAFAALLIPVGMLAACIALGASLSRGGEARPAMALEPRGLVTAWPRAAIPYDAIRDVADLRGGISVSVRGAREPLFFSVARPTGGSAHGLTDEERTHLIAQIRAAAARARGLGPSAPEVAMQVADLRRGEEGARAWLARLDGLAEQTARGGGYRGATLDPGELWAALEDPEASPEIRAAAARVLARTDPSAPERALRIAASAREATTERRIRVALDPELDVEAAAHEMDDLDRKEKTQRRGDA